MPSPVKATSKAKAKAGGDTKRRTTPEQQASRVTDDQYSHVDYVTRAETLIDDMSWLDAVSQLYSGRKEGEHVLGSEVEALTLRYMLKSPTNAALSNAQSTEAIDTTLKAKIDECWHLTNERQGRMGPLITYVRMMNTTPNLRSTCALMKRCLALRSHCTMSRELILTIMRKAAEFRWDRMEGFDEALKCLLPLMDCCLAEEAASKCKDLEGSLKFCSVWGDCLDLVADKQMLFSRLNTKNTEIGPIKPQMLEASRKSKTARCLLRSKTVHLADDIVKDTVEAAFADLHEAQGSISMDFVRDTMELAASYAEAVCGKVRSKIGRLKTFDFCGLQCDEKAKNSEDEALLYIAAETKLSMILGGRSPRLPWEWPLKGDVGQVPKPTYEVEEAVVQFFSRGRDDLAALVTEQKLSDATTWKQLTNAELLRMVQKDSSVRLEHAAIRTLNSDQGSSLVDAALSSQFPNEENPVAAKDVVMALQEIGRSKTFAYCTKQSRSNVDKAIEIFDQVAHGKPPGQEVFASTQGLLARIRDSLPYTVFIEDPLKTGGFLFGTDALKEKILMIDDQIATLKEVNDLLAYAHLLDDGDAEYLVGWKESVTQKAAAKGKGRQANMAAEVEEVRALVGKAGRDEESAGSTDMKGKKRKADGAEGTKKAAEAKRMSQKKLALQSMSDALWND